MWRGFSPKSLFIHPPLIQSLPPLIFAHCASSSCATPSAIWISTILMLHHSHMEESLSRVHGRSPTQDCVHSPASYCSLRQEGAFPESQVHRTTAIEMNRNESRLPHTRLRGVAGWSAARFTWSPASPLLKCPVTVSHCINHSTSAHPLREAKRLRQSCATVGCLLLVSRMRSSCIMARRGVFSAAWLMHVLHMAPGACLH